MKKLCGIFDALVALITPSLPPEDWDKLPGAPKVSTPKCTVLAIDDDREFLSILRTQLLDAGFRVLSSNSGPKGLDLLRHSPREIRVVLLDFNMPEFDGAETLQHIRALNPRAKVVGLTGINLDQLPPAFCNGLDGFVAKPYRQSELFQQIRSLIPTSVPAAG